MKLLIVTSIFPPDIGGPASYGEQLARELSDRHEVTVLTYATRFSYKEKQPYQVISVWRRWPKIIRHPLYVLKVFFALRKSDIAYTLSMMNGGLALWFATKFVKRPYAIRVVGDWAWEYAATHGKTTLMIDDFQKSSPFG